MWNERYKNLKNRIFPVITLAVPIIIENILQIMIGVADMFFVGRIGTEAIAAVGLTNLIMSILIAFFSALSIGTGAMIARYWGENNKEKAKIYMKHFLLLAAGTGLAAGVVSILFSKACLKYFSASEEMYLQAVPYFNIVAIPSVILSLTMILGSAIKGTGDTRTPMKIGFLSNLFNILLTYTLTFGLFRLGILGVGLGTTLARALGLLLLYKALIEKEHFSDLKIFPIHKPDLQIMKNIGRLSLPAGAERLIMRIGQLAYGFLIIRIGVSAYAAHNVAGNIESFSYLPGIGFGAAGAILAGQSLGAKKPEIAEKYGWHSYLLGTIFMVIIGILFYFFAPLLSAFFSDDPQVIKQSVKVLRIIAFFQPFLAMTLIITGVLQGAGDTKFPMYTTFFGIWFVRLLGTYFLGIKMDMGLTGVWTAYALDITIRGIIIMLRFKHGKWKTIDL